MSQFRPTLLGLVAAIGFSMASGLIGSSSIAHAAEPDQSVRAEVGTPLQAVQALMEARKYKEAYEKVTEAENVANKSAFETYIIHRTRLAVAFAAQDADAAATAFDTISATGKFSQAEKIPFIHGLATLYYSARNFPKTIEWISRYIKEGGDDPTMRPLLIRAYYENSEFATASKEILSDIHAAEKAGTSPTEDQLKLLRGCAHKLGDKVAYADAMERLATYYPKPEYWVDLLNRVQAKPGYAGRLDLDVFRIKLAIGQLTAEDDFMDMATLALQAGFPGEAKKIAEMGYSANVLGIGPNAAKHKRLLDDATKKAAKEDMKTMQQTVDAGQKNKDGVSLFNVGYAYVTIGEASKGVTLMEQAVTRGGFKRPEDTKLHLGIAYAQADQKAKAIQMFKTVQGVDGTADLARLWVMHLSRPAT